MALIDFGVLFPFFIGHILQYTPSSKRNLSSKILFKCPGNPIHKHYNSLPTFNAETPMRNREMEGKAQREDKTAATSRL